VEQTYTILMYISANIANGSVGFTKQRWKCGPIFKGRKEMKIFWVWSNSRIFASRGRLAAQGKLVRCNGLGIASGGFGSKSLRGWEEAGFGEATGAPWNGADREIGWRAAPPA
jgi:hypothetical protein